MPELNNNRSRALMNAPCGIKEHDRRGNEITEYPGVDCEMNCKHCGWNPAEAKRRLETGHFVYGENGLRSLHFSTP